MYLVLQPSLSGTALHTRWTEPCVHTNERRWHSMSLIIASSQDTTRDPWTHFTTSWYHGKRVCRTVGIARMVYDGVLPTRSWYYRCLYIRATRALRAR